MSHRVFLNLPSYASRYLFLPLLLSLPLSAFSCVLWWIFLCLDFFKPPNLVQIIQFKLLSRGVWCLSYSKFEMHLILKLRIMLPLFPVWEHFSSKNYPSHVKVALFNVVEYFMNHTCVSSCHLRDPSFNTQLVWSTPLEIFLISTSENCFLTQSPWAVGNTRFPFCSE